MLQRMEYAYKAGAAAASCPSNEPFIHVVSSAGSAIEDVHHTRAKLHLAMLQALVEGKAARAFDRLGNVL